MAGQRLRPLPWGMTARAQWVLPDHTLTEDPAAAARAPWRPWLELAWRPVGTTLALVLMNPSAATAEQLDATVRNALYFALRLDINDLPVGKLIVVNAYDVRATTLDVEAGTAEVQLEQGGERVTLGDGLSLASPFCDAAISRAASQADLVVCGWGGKVSPERTQELLRGPLSGVDLHAWRRSGQGFPKHPRGQRSDLLPRLWRRGVAFSPYLSLQPPTESLRLRPAAIKPPQSYIAKRHRQRTYYGEASVDETLTSTERAKLWRWG